MRLKSLAIFIALGAILIAGSARAQTPTATDTPTATPTATLTATPTATPTAVANTTCKANRLSQGYPISVSNSTAGEAAPVDNLRTLIQIVPEAAGTAGYTRCLPGKSSGPDSAAAPGQEPTTTLGLQISQTNPLILDYRNANGYALKSRWDCIGVNGTVALSVLECH